MLTHLIEFVILNGSGNMCNGRLKSSKICFHYHPRTFNLHPHPHCEFTEFVLFKSIITLTLFSLTPGTDSSTKPITVTNPKTAKTKATGATLDVPMVVSRSPVGQIPGA